MKNAFLILFPFKFLIKRPMAIYHKMNMMVYCRNAEIYFLYGHIIFLTKAPCRLRHIRLRAIVIMEWKLFSVEHTTYLKINSFMKCYIFLMLAMGKSLKIQVISSYLAEIYFQEKVILRLFKYGILFTFNMNIPYKTFRKK